MHRLVNHRRPAFALIPLVLLASAPERRPSDFPAVPEVTGPAPFTVEYAYTVRWGHHEEFFALFRKNHVPVLRELRRRGHILEVSAVSPYHHVGEPDRWDLRVTVVWRDAEAAHGLDEEIAEIEGALFPDQARFEADEQRRFELLAGHTDTPVWAWTIDDG